MVASVWMEARCTMPASDGCMQGDDGEFHTSVRSYLAVLKKTGWVQRGDHTVCPVCVAALKEGE